MQLLFKHMCVLETLNNDVQESPIFLYEFAYEGNYTSYKYATGSNEHKGVIHADDMIYLFSMRPLFPLLEPGTLDGEMSDIYVETMVHFVQTGKVKEWTSFRPCSLSTSQPFCDSQVFKISPKDPKKILISTSNSIDEDMVKFWKMVDGIIDVKEPEPCP
ncbi:Carboxylesterase, type B [Sergentomyia squamirostris]